jgi:methionyl-tRNA formyltransferase
VAEIGVAATAGFGADVLERLAERHDVSFLLTRPDRPAGRGRKSTAPPAKLVAERLGVPVLQPERPSEAELDAETIVLVAYGALIPKDLLERHDWLNVHPSLLPRWRGAAPVERAIMAGDGETGVSVIRLVEELDAGPIGAQQAFPIGPDDDAGAVFARAAEVAPDLIDAATDFTPQPEEGATYAEKITPADRELDWARPAQELHDRIRALSPHIGARGELNGRNVLVWRSRVVDDRLEPLEVQPEGGKRMSYDAFLRGLRT